MKNNLKRITIVFIILLLSLGVSFAKDAKKEKKILYYRNPMNPAITSPTFMKDSMGMDYIPVYEEEAETDTGISKEAVVKIKESQQELIGIKTEPAITRPLMRMIRTVAKIAFDPELYKAQTEFIQANRTNLAASLAQSAEIKERLDALILAAGLKLKLLGLSDSQIEELKQASASDRGLLISDTLSPYVWAYLTIYEYDLGSVNVGDDVVLQAIAYPGEEFEGKIVAIDPVLEMNSRSVRARVQVNNPEGKLKPNMYGDAFIHIDLGQQLAVPREAVLDTGLRKLVYVQLGKGEFKAKEVKLGEEAVAVADGAERKFYPVKIGLEENEIVVTTGNFLIDSQSQLSGGMSALWGGATEIKQEEEQPAHRH
ncbi:MAG: efflux RND transporter periplasmic adaptor subunit [Candidatus Omnitrophica bacterium]|nr:efflux RND transporter periplasmic adaptor subunit [Candidatus Omnitrophota bacterium]